MEGLSLVNSMLLIAKTTHQMRTMKKTINDSEGQGEDGVATQLINIAIPIDDTTTIRTNVDGQKELPRCYVEKPTSFNIIKDTGTESTLNYTINLCELTNASKGELFHSRKVQALICF